MISLELARTVEALRARVPAWQELCTSVSEANVLYEPFMLVPAFEYLKEKSDVVVLFFYGPAQELVAVVPLQRVGGALSCPVPHYTLWRHSYCFLAVPLVRSGWEDRVMDALQGWLKKQGIAGAMLRFPMHPAGPFHQAVQAQAQGGWQVQSDWGYERALIRIEGTFEKYYQRRVSSKKRKQHRRLWQKLGRLGPVTYRVAREAGEVAASVEDFLALEHRGWKGGLGTSVASKPQHAAFLRQALWDGATRGQVEVRTLLVGARPVAMSIGLRREKIVFAFKIAFDEDFAECSPGVQLDILMLRELFSDSQVAWIDSCSDPDHPTEDSLWGEHRMMRVLDLTQRSWLGRGAGWVAWGMSSARKRLKRELRDRAPDLLEQLVRIRQGKV